MPLVALQTRCVVGAAAPGGVGTVQVGNLRALISDEYDRERGLGTPD